jgi:hypothetical protein
MVEAFYSELNQQASVILQPHPGCQSTRELYVHIMHLTTLQLHELLLVLSLNDPLS